MNELQYAGGKKYHKKKQQKYMKKKKAKKTKKKKKSLKKTNSFGSVVSMPKSLFKSVQSMKKTKSRRTKNKSTKKKSTKRGMKRTMRRNKPFRRTSFIKQTRSDTNPF